MYYSGDRRASGRKCYTIVGVSKSSSQMNNPELVPVLGSLGGRDGSLEHASCRVASATVEGARNEHTEL